VGSQYRSVLYYENENQRDIALDLINRLKSKGFNVVTEVERAKTFYKAEDYHQNYYGKKSGRPYCHFRVKRF